MQQCVTFLFEAKWKKEVKRGKGDYDLIMFAKN
jgi:hypothetical protein